MEIWKPIRDYEGLYEVSNFGNVKSLDRLSSNGKNLKGLILRYGIESCGYKVVALCKNSHLKTFKIHRLVAKAFIPNPKNKPCVNHKDGNKLNNYLDNLEWCTYSENTIHAYTSGLQTHHQKNGQGNSNAKLTTEKVKEIVSMFPQKSNMELSRTYNVHEETIGYIRRGKTWKHIQR